jgi:alpha-tubulin suppressor-like RCC1 family protein
MAQHHSAILNEEGQVYMFGRGSHGMLGLDSESNVVEPTLVESLTKWKVKDIALGDFHTVFLTDDGTVWTTGFGGTLSGGWLRTMFSQSGGGLGHGDKEDRFVPTPVDYFHEHGEEIV